MVTLVVTFWSLWWSLFGHVGDHFCCFSFFFFFTFAYFGVELRRVTFWSLLGSLFDNFGGRFLAWSFGADIFVIQFVGPPRGKTAFAHFLFWPLRVGAHFCHFGAGRQLTSNGFLFHQWGRRPEAGANLRIWGPESFRGSAVSVPELPGGNRGRQFWGWRSSNAGT